MYNKQSSEFKVEHCNEYITGLKNQLDKLDHQSIAKTIDLIEKAFLEGKKIFIAGNGGSAATASHIASDFQKTTLSKNPQIKNSEFKFKAISLSDNIPAMTAWGNDEGFDYIFSEQLKVLADKGDLLIIITGSGNSSNILKLVEEATNMGLETVGFLGFDGGKVKSMLDHYVIVESDNYGFVEDIHMILDHLITAYFKKEIQKIIELKKDILPTNLVNSYLKKENKRKMSKIVFIDRDGVLNKKAPEHEYIKKWDEFERNKGAKELIKYLNEKLYIVLVITNQQGIGKGQFSMQDLENIHKNMNADLKTMGAKIDKFYVCPHLSSENCNCRKPKTGMLENASKDLNIHDKSKMFLIGDSSSDIECANNFGIKSYKIESDNLQNHYEKIKKTLKQPQ